MLPPRPEAWLPSVLATNGVLPGMMATAALARPRWLTGAMLAGRLAFYAWFARSAMGR